VVEFGFALKKLIGFWLLPLSICVLLISSGLILLWLDKHKTLGKSLSTFGLLLLVLLSWNPTSNLLLHPIEYQFPIFDTTQNVDYVLVLGNQVNADSHMPVITHLSNTALERLLEGLRILKTQPNSKLIVSGYDGGASKSCAEVYAEVAILLGTDPARIIKMPNPKDTQEEAIKAKKIVKNSKVALVTSASHMPRALSYFENNHIHAIAAPTNHLTPRVQNSDWKFNSEGLLKSERAFYEALGSIWQWIIMTK
jgi:uncharacterized SAM-binding protein YcdF (DUF218 family)